MVGKFISFILPTSEFDSAVIMRWEMRYLTLLQVKGLKAISIEQTVSNNQHVS